MKVESLVEDVVSVLETHNMSVMQLANRTVVAVMPDCTTAYEVCGVCFEESKNVLVINLGMKYEN